MNPEGKHKDSSPSMLFSKDPLMLLKAMAEWRSEELQMTHGAIFDLAGTIEHAQYCCLCAGMF